MEKAPDAFRTISEVAEWLDTPTHVLRFWESRFPEVAPVKRAGGRRYYRVEDMRLLGGIKKLLHDDGATIKSVQERIQSEGADSVAVLSPPLDGGTPGAGADAPSEPAPDTASAESTTNDTAAQQAAGSTASGNAAKATTLRREPPLREAAQNVDSAPDKTQGDTPAPSLNPSFQRHPARVVRPDAPKPDRVRETRPHPTRPGLFVYDDSDVQPDPVVAASPPTGHQQLGSINAIPADPDDTCVAAEPLPLPADLRALAKMVQISLPQEAADAVAKMRALRARLK